MHVVSPKNSREELMLTHRAAIVGSIVVLLLAVLACAIPGGVDVAAPEPEEAADAPSPSSEEPEPEEVDPEEVAAEEPEEVEAIEQPPDQGIDVEVLSTSSYVDSIDALHIVGELQNTGNVDLEFVEVDASVYGADGTLIAGDFTYSETDVVFVDEIVPFNVVFIDIDVAGIDYTYELQIQAEPADFLIHSNHREFVVSDDQMSPGPFGGYKIVGQVENVGQETAEFVEVIATLYDADGNVVGVDFTFADTDTLDPGMKSPFTVDILSTSGEAASYKLIVEGSIPQS